MTSSSTSRDSIGTTRKTASGNYSETLSAIQRSDQMLWPFSPVIPACLHKASSSTSRDSISTTRKTASGNYCETLSAIQLSDQMLSPFFTCYSGLAPQGLLFNKLVFHRYYKENGLWKLLQNFERDPTVGSKVMALFSFYSGLARHDIHFND